MKLQKSSYCTMGNCVQVGSDHGLVAVVGKGQIALHFTQSEFGAFIAGVKAGEFDHFGSLGV